MREQFRQELKAIHAEVVGILDSVTEAARDGVTALITGDVVYVNAGHMPGLLRRCDGTFEQLSGGGIALGMFEQSKYQAHETTIEPGDTLVLYSDGVTEAENHKGQAFEESGLRGVVAANAKATPPDLARTILRVVEAHAQETYLADDLTVLVVRRKATTP